MDMTSNCEYVVYCHRNKLNGKRYIGITKSIERRWAREGAEYFNPSSPNSVFANAITKYGWDGFEHTVISSGLSREDACSLESMFIKLYKTNICRYGRMYGYNMTDGGDGGNGCRPSKETREKIRKTMTARGFPKEISDKGVAARRKMVLCKNTGEIFQSATEAAKHFSVALSAICSCCRGEQELLHGLQFKYISPDEASVYDVPQLSDEERKHIYNDAYLKHKDKLHADLTNRPIKAVLCIETNTVYKSMKEAAALTGGNAASISDCCRGRSHTSGGYHWKYANMTGMAVGGA